MMPPIKFKVTISLLLTFVLPFGVRGQICELRGGQYRFCQCEMSDGSGIVDLSPYANINGEPEFTVIDDSGSHEYEYNINLCFSLQQGGSCDTAAGCQSRASDDRQWSLGSFASAKFNIDPQDGLYLQFTGGDDEREMNIFLDCDNNVEIDNPDFKFNGESNNFVYDFTLRSPCACPVVSGICGAYDTEKNSDPGVVGILLMCLAFTVAVMYFIVGAVFLRVRYHKTGTDLIIHREFWMDFPFLVKDGVVFTFTPCINATRRQKGYSSIHK